MLQYLLTVRNHAPMPRTFIGTRVFHIISGWSKITERKLRQCRFEAPSPSHGAVEVDAIERSDASCSAFDLKTRGVLMAPLHSAVRDSIQGDNDVRS
ncbi:hypothetical protein Pla52o_01040 [Novipirellula galeiformis]|uniref:Uncharacterized protein n=1 Tax=Novipirellula galeiformis TaxID=2528004 RepID=A0A5C6CS51_9BACT|nr:hypothetical protein Pla52o_01040 [Novipirellula galeiformis]